VRKLQDNWTRFFWD